MTIREALDLYKAQGPAAVHEGFRDAVELLIKNQVGTPLENDCYLDALYLTDMMFQRTNENLSILTGGNADQFLEALKSSFEKALERIQKTAGKARMIILDSEVPSLVTELAERFKGVFEVRRGQLKPGAKINHLIACDARMVRVEEPHGELTLDSDSGAVKAKVSFDNEDEVKRRVGFFDAAWVILGA
jgi:hypothetical protein